MTAAWGIIRPWLTSTGWRYRMGSNQSRSHCQRVCAGRRPSLIVLVYSPSTLILRQPRYTSVWYGIVSSSINLDSVSGGGTADPTKFVCPAWPAISDGLSSSPHCHQDVSSFLGCISPGGVSCGSPAESETRAGDTYWSQSRRLLTPPPSLTRSRAVCWSHSQVGSERAGIDQRHVCSPWHACVEYASSMMTFSRIYRRVDKQSVWRETRP